MDGLKGPLVLKLGGSVITDKNREFQANLALIGEIAREVSRIKNQLILVHGAGSFAHPLARKHGLHEGFRDASQLMGLAETKRRLTDLSQILLGAFVRAGLPVVHFMTSSILYAERGRIAAIEMGPLRRLVKLGVVPMLSGDVVVDTATGLSIVSGDQIAPTMAIEFNAEMVIFGCDVDGVYHGDPKKDPNAKLVEKITPSMIDDLANSVGGSSAADVTRGMAGKLMESKRLLEVGTEVVIMNLTRPQDLTKLLNGKEIRCTRLVPD